MAAFSEGDNTTIMDPHFDWDPPFDHFKIFTKMGPIELKLCICALVDIPITIAAFFVCQVARKTRLKKRPLSRWPMDAVSELQPEKRDRICIASCLGVLSLNLSLFWTVTGCDRSKGGSRSKCGSVIVHFNPKPFIPLRHLIANRPTSDAV